jgi:hypothetical protein
LPIGSGGISPGTVVSNGSVVRSGFAAAVAEDADAVEGALEGDAVAGTALELAAAFGAVAVATAA